MVRDYRALNITTQPDRYPLPFVNDFGDILHGCAVFSKLDCFKGYHQIQMAAEDGYKTAIITPVGLYEYKMLTFLGHHISTKGFEPIKQKVQTITKFPKPQTIKQLRRFLGMINFYRRFISGCAEILQPLNKMLSPAKSSKKKLKCPWKLFQRS